MTRQRLWQLEQESNHRCRICGKPEVTRGRCEYHRRKNIEYTLAWYYRKKRLLSRGIDSTTA